MTEWKFGCPTTSRSARSRRRSRNGFTNTTNIPIKILSKTTFTVCEQIPEVYTDMIWLENTFKGHWVLQLSDSPYERVYQNYTLSATI